MSAPRGDVFRHIPFIGYVREPRWVLRLREWWYRQPIGRKRRRLEASRSMWIEVAHMASRTHGSKDAEPLLDRARELDKENGL